MRALAKVRLPIKEVSNQNSKQIFNPFGASDDVMIMMSLAKVRLLIKEV